MNHEFQNFMFFSVFLFDDSKETRSTRKINVSTSKCCHFFNFRNFAVLVVHGIATFIPIKMVFGFSVSNNQVSESRQPFEPVFKNMLYPRLYNFHDFH